MRWFLWLLLVLALIAGTLYGVGRFLLPNGLEVTATTTIERPRAAVFAMANDLRIAREWSPYYAMDPDADFQFSGDGPGAGQTMRWMSNNRNVGVGRISIVSSAENEEIESILDLGERATLNSLFRLRRGEAGTHVAWSVTAQCSEGWINVPCRYMNLILRPAIEDHLNNGLMRLKTLTEQLPNIDFEQLHPVMVTAEPQAYVYSSVTTSNRDPAQVDQALNDARAQVVDYMRRYDLVAAGPQIRVVTDWSLDEGRMSFRVGYPYAGATPLTLVGVQFGETPSGRALRVQYEGPRQGLQAVYQQIYAYLQAHRIGIREGGLPWEVDHSEAAANATARIDIYVPLQ